MRSSFLKDKSVVLRKTINDKLTYETKENLCKKTSNTLHALQGIKTFATEMQAKNLL